MKNINYLLKDIFPDLTVEIKKILLKNKRIDLYEQIDKLEIIALCGCGQENCGSFYTILPPKEEVEYAVEGFIISDAKVALEVYEGKVGYVEIFPSEYDYEIHKKLAEIFR
ncbi:MAG: hypothetical protein WBL93_07755 [Lutisporaceae bacterium]